MGAVVVGAWRDVLAQRCMEMGLGGRVGERVDSWRDVGLVGGLLVVICQGALMAGWMEGLMVGGITGGKGNGENQGLLNAGRNMGMGEWVNGNQDDYGEMDLWKERWRENGYVDRERDG